MIRTREELTYVDCQAVVITGYLRIIEVVIDHEPSCVLRDVKPGLNSINNLIEVLILVYA